MPADRAPSSDYGRYSSEQRHSGRYAGPLGRSASTVTQGHLKETIELELNALAKSEGYEKIETPSRLASGFLFLAFHQGIEGYGIDGIDFVPDARYVTHGFAFGTANSFD